MNSLGRLLPAAVMLTVIAGLAAVISAWADVPFLVVFIIAVLATLANGLLATLEDDLPGGFNNPDGTDTPPYVQRLRGSVWRTIAVLALLLAAAFAWLAFRGGDRRSGVLAVGVAATVLIARFAFRRNR
jgi:hypothetical protein